MNVKRNKRKRFTAVLLCGALCISGCGTGQTKEAPALIEPVSTNVSYRPVERGDVGNVKVLYATVVPTDYCSFFDTSVEVSKLLVEPGDMVEEGQAVAYADTENAAAQCEELEKELAYENQMYALNARLGSLNQQKLSAEGQETELAIEQENAYYDGLLHERHVAKLTEELTKLRKVLADGTLYARHSGLVTYVKNIAAGNAAGAYENIVIVSDTQDIYLELSGTTTKTYTYGDYEVKYIKKDGKCCEVTEIPYTDDERILARARGSYPNIRLGCPEGGNFTIGEMYPVYYRKKAVTDVLVVEKGSLYEEDDGYYVYVKTEDEGTKRRAVTVGETDDNYAEITEGLTEGEMVACSLDSGVPVDYEEYEVETTNYEVKNYSQDYRLVSRENSYVSEYVGRLTLAVEVGDEVEAGDLLYTVNTGEGKAALTEAQYQIDDENRQYQKQQEDYDKQLAALTDEQEIERQMIACQKEIAQASHEYQLATLTKQREEVAKKKGGTGTVSVYAKESGSVSKLYHADESLLEAGDAVLLVEAPTNRQQLLVKMTALNTKKVRAYLDNIADIGEQVTIETEGGDYTGHCVAQAVRDNNIDKAYLTTDSEGNYLSYGTDSGYSAAAFFVEMDDTDFYEKMYKGLLSFSYVSMQEMIVLSTALVGREKRVDDPNKTYYYVWRLSDGGPVKQYIQIDEQFSDEITTVVLSGLSAGDVLARVE